MYIYITLKGFPFLLGSGLNTSARMNLRKTMVKRCVGGGHFVSQSLTPEP